MKRFSVVNTDSGISPAEINMIDNTRNPSRLTYTYSLSPITGTLDPPTPCIPHSLPPVLHLPHLFSKPYLLHYALTHSPIPNPPIKNPPPSRHAPRILPLLNTSPPREIDVGQVESVKV